MIGNIILLTEIVVRHVDDLQLTEDGNDTVHPLQHVMGDVQNRQRPRGVKIFRTL